MKTDMSRDLSIGDLFLYLIEYLYKLKQNEDAEKILDIYHRKVTSLSQDDIDVYNMDDAKLHRVLEVYKDLLENSLLPKAKAHEYIGDIYLRNLKNNQEAIKEYELSLNEAPNWEGSLSGMAEAYGYLKDWTKSIEFHKKIAEISDEYSASAWERIGDLYRDELKDLEKALSAYKQSLEKEPERASSLVGIARAYEAFEKWEEAIESHEHVAEISDEYRKSSEAYQLINKLRMGREEEVQRHLDNEDITPEKLFVIAKHYEDIQQWVKAIDSYERFAEISDEYSASAWEHIGDLYRDELKDLAKALSAYKQSLEKEPERVSSLFGTAKAYEAFEKWEEAIESHKQVVDASKEYHSEALEHIGDLYRDELKDLAKALSAYKQSLEKEPERVSSLIGTAKAYEAFEKWEEAIDSYQQVAEVSEDNRSAAWERIGDLYRDELKDLEKALSAYKQSLEKEPERASSLVGIARAYEAFEKWEEAIESHEHVAEISDEYRKSSEAYQLLNLLKMGQEEEVKQRLDKENVTPEMLAVIGNYHEDNKEFARAIEFHIRVAEVSEEYSASAWEHIGDLYRDELKDLDKALKAYERSLEKESERVSSLVSIAKAYEAFDKWEKAIEFYRRVADVSEKARGDVLLRVGSIYLQYLNNYLDAIEIFDNIRSLWKKDPPNLLMQLARSYEGNGQKKKANATYKEIEKYLNEKLEVGASATVLRRLAWVNFKTNHFEKAIDLCNKIVEDITHIDKIRSELIRAAILFLKNDFDGAKKEVEELFVEKSLTDDLLWEIKYDLSFVKGEKEITSFTDLIENKLTK